MPRLFIIGGSDAGISAALRARELAPDWQVTVAVADSYPNFSICGIPYFMSGEVEKVENLAHRKADDIRALGVELLLDHRAEHINPVGQKVVTSDETGRAIENSYDKLVIATGAASVQPRIAGMDLPGVYLLRWIGDALAFDDFIARREPRHVVIIGGGYIGLEMAEALRRRRVEVTIVEMAPSVMTTIDPNLGTKVGEELERNGVRLAMGQSVSSISRVGNRLQIQGGNSFVRESDMALVAVGARPETKLAISAGVIPGFKGALKVNRSMETNLPNVYAAGDCVETWHRITQENSYLPLGTTSHKQGRIAGENAVGGNRLFEGSLGTQSVRLFDYVVARTGFHDRDARNAGLDPVSVDCVSWDHKVYYPNAREMSFRVTGDRISGRLLGAQLIGRYGAEVSKRIDIFAAAIHHRMTMEEVSDLDLSYTPPLSSPWDPVQMATQKWTSVRNACNSKR